MAAKIAVWASLTEAKREPLLACLEALQTHAPEEIAAGIMERAIDPQGSIPAAAEADTGVSVEKIGEAEGLPVLIEVP